MDSIHSISEFLSLTCKSQGGAVSESSVTVSSNVSKFTAWLTLCLCQLNRTNLWCTRKQSRLNLTPSESLPVWLHREDRCSPSWEKGLGPEFPSQVICRWGMGQIEGEGLSWKPMKWSERGLKGTQDAHWPQQGSLKPHMPFKLKKWASKGHLNKTAVKSHRSGDKVFADKESLLEPSRGFFSHLSLLEKNTAGSDSLCYETCWTARWQELWGRVIMTSWQSKEHNADLWPESWAHSTVKSKGL